MMVPVVTEVCLPLPAHSQVQALVCFSNLRVWALGVYHGLRRKHLQTYLDEFVFRFNRRRPPASSLQDVDLTGSKGMSLISGSKIDDYQMSFFGMPRLTTVARYPS